MKVQAIKTNLFHLGNSLFDFVLREAKEHIKENSILAVTSKIVSLSEEAIVFKSEVEKEDLIQKESDYYLGEVAFGCHLTIKHRLFIASAGIDQSNADGDYYILYPNDPFLSAQKLGTQLREHFNLKNFGVLFTDSHTTPLRRGVTGIALSYWGFNGLINKVGENDLFGNELKVTTINTADALASASCLLMGEGNEQCPLAVIETPPVEFNTETDITEITMNPEDDMYFPIYKDKIIRKNNPGTERKN